ncbi:hypothetical protein Skr01_13220 [Sphaerisporangium krabiense]|uniref:Alpha-mannosidase n=1 Tax=Sphaerisporangium krabiense TaxID=763782 RepID=A0A7W8ZBU8_9ACTN|nr:alpha-mannosidase [Sphaerisporangium krabiense]MBB5631152.1 alpha-mannosidase [Sphaerisporangium krabiense]GII61237.1 hypothetical protein Skr01_13220 [Sphaerisporangium krabiense]
MSASTPAMPVPPMPSPPGEADRVVVVPHTHWDREWYLPFQRFRMGLVRMLDEVLDAMDADPAYRFTMDGQLAAVHDYLEIRPERRAALARLTAEGRFAAGPWMILADEFLCSGETLIRNLEYGLRGARELGGAMEVGYLPDQFGHCAQMPQILALAGLRVACLWRGVPAAVRRDAFAWKGADGTVIPVKYLPGGYGNAVALFSGPEEGLPDRVAAFAETMRRWQADGPLLAMYGADHSAPARGITGSGLRLATLGEYLSLPGALTVPGDAPVVDGELRSHARANILPGVLSARVPLKQAMGRAERVLTRYAEPLAALWLGGGERAAAGRLIELAWRQVIACSGHDSITGCGADETAGQVAARIAEAEQIGQAVTDLVSASLAEAAGPGRLAVVNPSPVRRTGLVLADLPGDLAGLAAEDGTVVPVQVLDHAPTLLDETRMTDLTRLLGRVHERELFGQEIVSWSAEDDVFTVVVARHPTGGYRYADLKAAIAEAAARHPGPWLVRTVAEPTVTVAALVDVPPLARAFLTTTPAPVTAPVPDAPPFPPAAVRVPEDGVLDNGLLRVAAEADGTLTLTARSGLTARGVGRIVDGGDAGDTYNHAPPAADRLVATPGRAGTRLVCAGPLVSVLEIARMYAWPVGAEGEGRAARAAEVTVTTRAELRAGEPYLRLAVTFDNPCRDHRVRWHAPTPRPAAESFAGGQYAVVRRGTSAEGGGGEEPLPTFPASGFVTAGGLAVLPGHTVEYELLHSPANTTTAEPAAELAVTLLRAVGYLSRNGNPLRDEPAGPQVATPDAQCPGPVTTHFAVLVHEEDWDRAGLARLAEEYHHDLLAVPGTTTPDPAAREAWRHAAGAWGQEAGVLELGGDGVVLGALRWRGEWLEVRLVALRSVRTEAVLRGAFTAARLADTLGQGLRPLEVTEGVLRLPLRPFEIATVHVR